MTDLGTVPEKMLRRLRGVNAIVLEANYDEATIRRKLDDPHHAADHHYLSWVLSDRGHLSNQQCAETLAGILTDRDAHVLLGHLSENHEDPRQDNNDHRSRTTSSRRSSSARGLPMPHMHRTFRIGRGRAGPATYRDLIPASGGARGRSAAPADRARSSRGLPPIAPPRWAACPIRPIRRLAPTIEMATYPIAKRTAGIPIGIRKM